MSDVIDTTPSNATPENETCARAGIDTPYIGKNGQKLSLRQLAFVKYLTTPDSGTFGNKYQSALKAGYSPDSAYQVVESTGVRNAIDRELKAANADSKVRTGVIANILHKETNVTEQYSIVDGEERLVSRTVSDNGKLQLQAARELARIDGTYHRAATMGHAERRVLDSAIDVWTRKLRASLAPHAALDAASEAVDVEGSAVVQESGEGGADAVVGQGSEQGADVQEGTTEGVGGG